jgi:hypothetical protein
MQKLTLTPKKQLIDLNKDQILFDIEVTAVTDNQDIEFEGCILNQTELDNGVFNYKKFKGALKARIKNDKNIYQNYFLCLKSTTGSYPININIINHPPPEQFKEPLIESLSIPPRISSKPKKSQSIFNFKTLIILAITIGIGVGLFYLWKGGGVKSSNLDIPFVNNIPNLPTPVAPKLEVKLPTKIASPNLMSRLNKIVNSD